MVQMGDAQAANFAHGHTVERANCLAHARRHFVEAETKAMAARVEAEPTGDGRDGVALEEGRGLKPQPFRDAARAAADLACGCQKKCRREPG